MRPAVSIHNMGFVRDIKRLQEGQHRSQTHIHVGFVQDIKRLQEEGQHRRQTHIHLGYVQDFIATSDAAPTEQPEDVLHGQT